MEKLNSDDLKNYYYNTLSNIEDLNRKITEVSKELKVYRKRRHYTTADIDDLLKRRDKMMKEFSALPKRDEK